MKTRLLAILASTVMLIAACGGGSDSASTDTQRGTESTSGDEEVEFESPLGEFLGWSQANFDEEAAQAEWAEQERQVQEQVARCMQEQGFEYTPVDRAASNEFFEEQLQEGLEWGSEEWTRKYGFGVTTQRFSQSQVGPDLVGMNWDFSGPDDGPPDPNHDYVESLSDNERDAYYEALYGGPEDFIEPVWEIEGREPTDEELIAYEENYRPTGCEPVAYEEIFNAGPGREEDWRRFDQEFGSALEELESRMESHPDVIAYRDGVRACVEERGVQYLAEEAVYEFFEEQLDAAGLGWEDQPDPLEGIDTSDFTDEDYERVFEEFQNKPLPADQLEALAELQALEIDTAVALHECGGGWENEQRALANIRIELEEEFLAANADRLAEFEGVFGN